MTLLLVKLLNIPAERFGSKKVISKNYFLKQFIQTFEKNDRGLILI
jgi:hypothetical protein